MKKLITPFVFLMAFTAGIAQVAPSWVKYSGPANYQNYDVQEVSTATDSVGNVYTAASMYDTITNLNKAMLVKYNPAGVQQWIQYYDNPDADFNGTYIKKILVDKSGNSYLCGYGKDNGTDNLDFFIIKYDNTGSMQWNIYLDGGNQADDIVTSATFDSAGNVIIAGYANHGATSYANGDDIAAAKFTKDGTLIWFNSWNNTAGNDEDRALAVACDLEGNVFVSGSTYQTSTGRDMVTIKFAKDDGSNVWTKIYNYTGNTGDDRAYSVIADSLGNSYITGAAGDWTTIKYGPTGNVVWEKHYTALAVAPFKASKILLDRSNNVIIAGAAFASTSEQDNYVVVKYTNAGVALWSTDINSPAGGESTQELYDALVDSAGYTYISGTYDGNLSTDILTTVVSPSGATVWNNGFSNSLNPTGTDVAYAMALDRNRNIIIAGVSQTRTSQGGDNVDVVTLKYNALNLATGITDIAVENANVVLFPNPTHGGLTIKLSDENLIGAVIAVTNILGQTVSEQKVTSLTEQLNLNNVAKGMYVVSVKTDKAAVSRKIIIE